MTLQYETGTSSGTIDLLEKLADFIGAPGNKGQNTTVVREDAPGTITGHSNDQQLVLEFSTPGVIVAFQTDVDNATTPHRIWFEPALSLGLAGTPYDGHTGGYAGGHTSLTRSGISAPASGSTFTYHFFHDDGWLYIVLKFDGGYYQHAFVGQLEVIGSHNYGFYVCGMTSKNVLTEDYNTTSLSQSCFTQCHPIAGGSSASSTTRNGGSIRNHDGEWIPVHQGSEGSEDDYKGFAQTLQGYPYYRYLNHRYSLCSPPSHHLSSNFVQAFRKTLVAEPHVTLAGSDSNMAIAGYVPGAFLTSNEVISEDAVLTIGSDDYIIFPVRTRRIEHRERYTAIAVKKP